MKTLLRHVSPKDPEEWALYHALRRSVLWDGGKRYSYRSDHPDETAEGNFPMIFFVADRPVGVVRIDLKKKRKQIIFRRMAISVSERRKGYGTLLLEAAEAFGREHGCDTFVTYVPPGEVSFYLKLGYSLDPASTGRDPENLRVIFDATKGKERIRRRHDDQSASYREPPLKLPTH